MCVCLCSLEESKCLEQHGIHKDIFGWTIHWRKQHHLRTEEILICRSFEILWIHIHFLWWLWCNTKRICTNIQLNGRRQVDLPRFLLKSVSSNAPTAVDSTGKQINSQQGQSNSCLKYNVLDYINEVGRVLTSSEACLILCTIPSCPRYWRDSQRGKARSFSTGWLEVRPAARDCPSRQGG